MMSTVPFPLQSPGMLPAGVGVTVKEGVDVRVGIGVFVETGEGVLVAEDDKMWVL